MQPAEKGRTSLVGKFCRDTCKDQLRSWMGASVKSHPKARGNEREHLGAAV